MSRIEREISDARRDAEVVTRDAGRVTRSELESRHSLIPFCRVPRPVSRVTPCASRVTTRGFSLVAALFLIVVVAALGAFAVRIGAGQQQTVNLALLSAKALSAANSGIEYGAYRALNGTCAASNVNLTEAGLAGFAVDVTCSSSTHAEGIVVYRIDATASYGTYGMPDFVSRHVYATFSSTP